MKYARLLIGGMFCMVFQVAMAAGASLDAHGWLVRMSRAVQDQNYEGVFVYRRGNRLETMRVIHRVGKNGQQERLVSLNGSPREIIQANGRITRILPNDHTITVASGAAENPVNALVPSDIDHLSKYYRFEMFGNGRVAGRAAVLVGIRPRDQYRYGYSLWIDRASGLLLRSDLLDEHGVPIEQLMFTRIETPATIPESALKSMSLDKDLSQYDGGGGAPAASHVSTHWRITNPPAGFRLKLHQIGRISGSDGMVEHMLYSDGLASVSVYIEENPVGAAFTGRSKIGALSAYGRLVNGHQVTVVGEVPMVTMKMLADSVEFDSGQ